MADKISAANLRHVTDGFTSPPKGRHSEDFFARKIRSLQPGLNPRTWVSEVQEENIGEKSDATEDMMMLIMIMLMTLTMTKKKEGIPHIKAKLGASLKKRWESKVTLGQYIRSMEIQLIGEEVTFLWLLRGEI
jgi:hypothetical protein